MDENYIPPAEGYRKLDFAYNTRSSAYVFGATGFGKTTLVHQYVSSIFPKNEILYLSPEDIEWDVPEFISCVVFDELHIVRDEERWQCILSLTKREGLWVIMIGRMPTPQRLIPLVSQCRLVVISEDDLALNRSEIAAIAGCENVDINEETLDFLFDKSLGNAMIVSATIQMLRSGYELNDELRRKILEAYLSHLENYVITQWSPELQEFLMQVSVVDNFTLPLAVMITGDSQAAMLIDEAIASGNFMKVENGIYCIRPQLLEALRSRALKIYGLDTYRQFIDRAGLYYETKDDILPALNLYEQSANSDRIHTLLLRSARRHPGSRHYFDLRRYYLALDEDEVGTSPTLMCAMSMLYSVLMNADKSEYWYDKLKEYAKNAKGGDRIEANSRLIYLDIGLPHRASVDLPEFIKHIGVMLRNGNFTIPELSVTNNQPSTMNGGKDFCEWSKKDVLLANTIGKIMEHILGSFGRGLIHAALAESFYEKKNPDYDIFNHLTQASAEVEGGGKTELLFAVVGIHVRLNLVKGDLSRANAMLNSFEKRAKDENAVMILQNTRALRCRLSLYTGKLTAAEEWLKEAPDELEAFCTLERYRYSIKVRIYLAEGFNDDAVYLCKLLLSLAEADHRPYIRMEAKMLMSIAFYREGTEWQETFLEVLREAESFRFVRIISEDGAAVLPLLKEISKTYLDEPGANREWFRAVLDESRRIAEYFPGYLTGAVQRRQFSEEQLNILRLQANGLGMKEIAAELFMSERAVKYHAAENYRKLDAAGKTDAVQKARNLHLI